MESIKKFFREQPLLAGCGSILVLMLLLCGLGAPLLESGWHKIGGVVSDATGVDSFFDTAVDVSAAGFSFEVSNTTDSGIEYTMQPDRPREVSCEELKAILGQVEEMLRREQAEKASEKKAAEKKKGDGK